MIEYLALHLFDSPHLLKNGATYKTRFLVAFLMFNTLIILTLLVLFFAVKNYNKRQLATVKIDSHSEGRRPTYLHGSMPLETFFSGHS